MTDEPLAVLDAFEGHAYAVSFAPDGQNLLVGGFGGLIRVYDTTSLQEVGQYAHHEKSTNYIAFAPDGQSFAVSSSDRTISIWQSDADAPSAILKGHRNTVMGMSWSRGRPNGWRPPRLTTLFASGARAKWKRETRNTESRPTASSPTLNSGWR